MISAPQQRKYELIPSILVDLRITGIIQRIEPNVRQQHEQDLRQQQQQQQLDMYVTIALQEQKEQQQQQQEIVLQEQQRQKKQHDEDMKNKYRKQQQKHKYRKERKQIERRLGPDNKRHKKKQEYFEDFIMKQSKANDVTGSINRLYIDMKNKSVSMLASIPTRTTKNKMKKKKYEMKKLVLELIDAHQDELRHNHEQQYKDNPDLFPDNPT